MIKPLSPLKIWISFQGLLHCLYFLFKARSLKFSWCVQMFSQTRVSNTSWNLFPPMMLLWEAWCRVNLEPWTGGGKKDLELERPSDSHMRIKDPWGPGYLQSSLNRRRNNIKGMRLANSILFLAASSKACHTVHPTFERTVDECKPGNWNFPNCEKCECNGHADTCHPNTSFKLVCEVLPQTP